jgi:hypothetical protein
MSLRIPGLQKQAGGQIKFKHEFSAEIVPFKQAYIERNFGASTIFRDVTEFMDDGITQA